MLRSHLKFLIPSTAFVLLFAYFISDPAHVTEVIDVINVFFFSPVDPFNTSGVVEYANS